MVIEINLSMFRSPLYWRVHLKSFPSTYFMLSLEPWPCRILLTRARFSRMAVQMFWGRRSGNGTNFPPIMRTKNFTVNDYSTSVPYSFVKCVKLDKEYLNNPKWVLHYEGCNINKNMNTRHKRNVLSLYIVISNGKTLIENHLMLMFYDKPQPIFWSSSLTIQLYISYLEVKCLYSAHVNYRLDKY